MKCINREKWEQRACPLGTWSFRARLGKPCPHARAAARPASRRCWGSGPGSGIGSNPTWFFLNWTTRVWCTSGSRLALLCCNGWKEPLQRFLSGGFALQTVPRNSAPLRGLKYSEHNNSLLSLLRNSDLKRVSLKIQNFLKKNLK